MTSKECLKDIQMFINEAYSDNEPLQENQIKSKRVFNDYCNIIKQDLDRLEKVIGLLWYKNVNIVYIKIFKDFKKYSEYYTGYSSKDKLTKEEFELLKDVLENGL